jgi:hypothetical protein
MIDNPQGGYQFLKGGGPFSSGCRAAPGYEIVHAVFHSQPPLDQGFDLVEQHLKSLGRPLQALCGMELRIPEPLSIDAFVAFNEPYIEKLKSWDVFLGELNPVARTNVALEPNRVGRPVVHGFSYTIESARSEPTLVAAGAGEVKSSRLAESEIVRHGDTSTQGLAEKAAAVLDILSKRLAGMEADWSMVTAVDVYCVHNIHAILAALILPRLKQAARGGIHWFHARPPVIGIDFEMDARGVRQEIVLP